MIYLVSTAGHPNYGDELIARGWLSYLAENQPEEDVWLDCQDPGGAAILFDGIHPNAHFTNTLWRTVWDAPQDAEFDALREHVIQKVNNFGTPLYDLGLMKLREARSIHLLGGGFINKIWPQHIGLVIAMVAVKALTGARLAVTGTSLVPSDSPQTLQELFQDFDHISARDAETSSILGVEIGLDDAFLSVSAELRRADSTAVVADLVLCLQDDLAEQGAFEWGLEIAREAIAVARANNQTIRYIEALPGSDWVAYDKLGDVLKPEEFTPFAEIWRKGLRFAPHQKWVTSRFHLHFMAAAAGARGTAVEINQDYYRIKHGSLRELGTRWSINEPLTEESASPLASEYLRRLTERVSQKRAEAESLYPKTEVVPEAESKPAALGKLRDRFSRLKQQ